MEAVISLEVVVLGFFVVMVHRQAVESPGVFLQQTQHWSFVSSGMRRVITVAVVVANQIV